MVNFDSITQENVKKEIFDHTYRILITGSSGSAKANAFLNQISLQPNIGEIYLHAKDPYEAKIAIVN